MEPLQPSAIGVCFAVSALLGGCDDAVLGRLPDPLAASARVALSPRNLVLSGDCPPARRSVHLEGWRGEPGAPELHVVGLRSAEGVDPVRVYVSRSAPMILAIASPPRARWEVVAPPAAQIERVLVVGEGAEVEADGVPVEPLSATEFGCGHRYPPEGTDCNTYALVDALERLTGQPLSSFQGCQVPARFGVIAPLPARWDESATPQDVELSVDGFRVELAASSGERPGVRATTPLWEGRWYFEVEVRGSTAEAKVGVGLASGWLDRGVALEGLGWGVAYAPWGGWVHNPEVAGPGPRGATFGDGDRVGIAVDLDQNRIWAAINGVWAGSPPDREGVPLGAYGGALPLFPAVFLGPGQSAIAHFDRPIAPPPGFRLLDELEERP